MKLFKFFKKAMPFIGKKSAIKNIISIVNIATKLTPTKIDNVAFALIAAAVRSQTKDMSMSEKFDIEDTVNLERSGPLKDISINVSEENKVIVETKYGGVTYNYNDGSLKWGCVGANS